MFVSYCSKERVPGCVYETAIIMIFKKSEHYNKDVVVKNLLKVGLKLTYLKNLLLLNGSLFVVPNGVKKKEMCFEVIPVKENISETKRNKMYRKFNNNFKKQFYRLKFCAHCSERGKKFKYCSKCKICYYCSLECQKKDWKIHKKICK